jgi:alpha-L-rhamnosidase
MKWIAKWIWDRGEEKPRNYWLCFRRNFILDTSIDDAVMKITADSRYILYLNGHRIGNGPVRCWPNEQAYDTWYVKDYIRHGANTIAVLVTHFGTSNFQYLIGRGGLLAQLDFYKDGEVIQTLATDKSWLNTVHKGYIRSPIRITIQQPWTEIYDARKFDSRWYEPSYDESNWENCIELGETGMKPWTKLVLSNIPHLTEDPVYPVRPLSLKEVLPLKQNILINYRDNFYPGDHDACLKRYMGYMATFIISPKDMTGRMSFSTIKRVKLNGLDLNAVNNQDLTVKLKKGANLLLIDISQKDFHQRLEISFDFDEKIEFKAPCVNDENIKFITIGPFLSETLYHQRPSDTKDEILPVCPEYDGVWYNDGELDKYAEWIKPIANDMISEDNVLAMCIKKKVIKEYDLDYHEYGNMISSNDSFTEIKPFTEGDIEFIVDFGKEVTGFIEFDIEAPKGTTLDFYMFESMADGIIEHTYGLHNTLRYISKDGRQSYRSNIRRGFRYLMVTVRGLKDIMRIYSLKMYLSTYPVVEAGQFKSSDYLLNEIWEISKHTTRLCMEDTFVDCPAYEQTFWVGDSRNESLINYYCFGAYNLSDRCLRLVIPSIYRSGLPESQVPSGWANIIPAWSFLWMMACREYYVFSGVKNLLKEVYPHLIQTAKNACKYLNKDCLFEISAWNIVDWADMDTPDSGIITHQNALLVKALNDVASIADILKKTDDAEWLRKTADSIRESINKHLWSDQEHAYVDSINADGHVSNVISLQTNIFAYLCGCVPDERKAIIESYLANPPKHFVKIGSPFMAFFYFEALAKINRLDLVLDFIRKEWGFMLEKDATTCWEMFHGWGLSRYTRSHCHAWSSAPVYFMGAYILGIRPAKPGFAEVLIEPRLCGLKWAKGTVPTPYGYIEVSCFDNTDKIDIQIKKPSAIKAKLVLPDSVKKAIYVNDRIVKNKEMFI